MAPYFKRRSTGISTLRLLFWTTLVLIAIMVILDRRPFVVEADDPEAGAAFEEIHVDGDVLILIDVDRTLARTRQGEFSRSYAWVDAFHQEYGPVSVLDVKSFDGELLDQYRFLVLTESTSDSEQLQSAQTFLENFVNNGGTLVLELPSGELRRAFAADGQGGWRTPTGITAVKGVGDDVASELMAMPLITRFMGSVRPLDGANTHLAMDGTPVVYSRRSGQGRVVVFDFAISSQLAALHQGIPGDRMQVRPRRAGQPVRVTDLIAAPQLFGSAVPFGDVLERFAVHAVISNDEPLFFFWPWPSAGRGALISSHQSRYVSGRPLWMSVHERDHEARTTTFVAPPDPQRDVQNNTEDEHVQHAALLWVVDPRDAGLQKAWGALGFHPVVQPLALEDQKRGIARAFNGLRVEDIHGIRIWSSRWDENFVRPFRVMQAHGFRYDISYGPVSGLPQGYLFGTCQPFQPLDTNGMPFSLQEVPVCFIDASTDNDLQLVGRALRRASASMDAVHVLTSADAFRDAPDMRAFDAWRDMLRYAERNGMWIGGAGQLVEFRRVRASAQLHVAGRSIDRDERTGDTRARRYVVEAEVPTATMTLAIPLEAGGMTLHSVVRGVALTQRGSSDELTHEDVEYGGQAYRLIPLASGFTTLTIRYGN